MTPETWGWLGGPMTHLPGRDRLVATTRLAGAEPALQRLAAAEERALYARTLTDVGDLAADHKQVRRALADGASWQQRLLAVAMPRSTVTTVLTVTTNAIADVLDLIDAGIAWLTRTLVPRRLRVGRECGENNQLEVLVAPATPALLEALHHRRTRCGGATGAGGRTAGSRASRQPLPGGYAEQRRRALTSGSRCRD